MVCCEKKEEEEDFGEAQRRIGQGVRIFGRCIIEILLCVTERFVEIMREIMTFNCVCVWACMYKIC